MKIRVYRPSQKPSTNVPHPVAGDMALSGDTRNPLHHKALPKRRGPNFETVESTTPSETSKEIVPSLYLRNGDMNVSGEEDGNY